MQTNQLYDLHPLHPRNDAVRTTLNLDEEALSRAMAQAPGRTRTAVINDALRLYARTKRRRQLLDRRGRVDWQGDVDAMRERV
jgi:Arc/MetJ family transcription regulator